MSGNKIVAAVANFYDDKITTIVRTFPQNNSKTNTNEHYKEIPKERFIYTEEKQKKIDNLRLI